MSEFIFRNLDTKVNISIPLDRNIIYIYGGNGTGKTTLSCEFALREPKSKVFNQDFINKNVYTVDSDGAKCNPINKENFAKLFVSEEAVKLAEEMVLIKEKNKQLDTLKLKNQDNLSQIIGAYKINTNVDLNSYVDKIDFSDSIFDYKKTNDENKSGLKSKGILSTSIKNNEELLFKIRQYSSNDQIRKIAELLNDVPLLKSIFIEKAYLDEINEIVEKYNSVVADINDLEKRFKDLGDTESVKKWVRDGIVLHHDKTRCIFCGSDKAISSITEWTEILQNKILEIKTSLLERIQKAIVSIDTNILTKSDMYIDLVPLLVKTSKVLNKVLTEAQDSLNKTIRLDSLSLTIELDDMAIMADKTYSEIVNFLINNDFVEYFFPYVYSRYLSSEQARYEKRANDASAKFAESTKGVIQEIASKLGFEKELRILSETRKGAVPKLALTTAHDDLKIGNLSEGQRHKLALAVFFAKMLLDNDKPDYMVLDDPMLSLDVVAYHKLKTFIIYDLKDKFKNSIILTHNISFLLIMLSNIFRDKTLKDKTKLLELKPNNCVEIQLEAIAKDDIVLFKDAVKDSSSIDDVTLWYWLMDKISRYFIDLKLSLKGIVSFNDVAVDLADSFGPDFIGRAKELNEIITETSKSKRSTIREVLIALKSLNEFISLLGFPIIIDEEEVDSFGNKFDLDLSVVENPNAKNFEFSVLKEGYTVAFDTTKSNSFLKDYIMHPRHQITESLVAFEAQRDK